MLAFLTRIVLALRSGLDSRASREAEILVLRQQLMVLNRKSQKRVRLQNIDRLILVWLYQIFPSVLDAIILVKAEPVIRWHRRVSLLKTWSTSFLRACGFEDLGAMRRTSHLR